MNTSVLTFGTAVALLMSAVASASLATAQDFGTARSAPGSLEDRMLAPAALQSADGTVQAFYRLNHGKAAWSAEAEAQLRRVLDDRVRHGLDHLTFLDALPAGLSDQRDVALTGAALRYAVALSSGAVDPKSLYGLYTIARPAKVDLVEGLARALQQGSLGEWFESLAPQTDEYRLIAQAYVASRDPSDDMAERAGDAGSSADPAGERVASDRHRFLAVALERLRWLEREPPATRIDVNTAATELTYFREGTVADRRRVIVGRPDKPTPQLQSNLFRLIANPTWSVPAPIVRDELAGKGAAYLRSRHMVRRGGAIVQLAGPFNALGLVKFDLDNDRAIYLHDTSARHLFGKDQRFFSHGCVRVENALNFAEMLALDQDLSSAWGGARQKSSSVALRERIPVRMLYHDVFVRDGRIVFVADPYGWSEQVAERLGFGENEGMRPYINIDDIGP